MNGVGWLPPTPLEPPELKQQMTKPISKTKIDRLREIIADIESFRFCGFSSDPDEVSAATIGYQYLLIQLQRLATPLLSETDAWDLNHLEVGLNDLGSVFDASAVVDALLIDIKDAIDAQEMQNQDQVTLLLHRLKQKEEFRSVHKDLERALSQANSDPASAVTAASSMIESMCKVYLETHCIQFPNNENIKSLWKTVSKHLGLDPGSKEDDNVKKVLSGLISIVSGVGALRTRAGSAHGRGVEKPYKLEPRHAWLVINASSTIRTFVLKTINQKTAESGISLNGQHDSRSTSSPDLYMGNWRVMLQFEGILLSPRRPKSWASARRPCLS